LEDRVNAALDVCDDLLTVLPAVIERLAVLEAAAAPGAPGERRSDYRFDYPAPRTPEDLHEQADRARQAWERLHDWVTWLVGTYRLTTVIPACWPEHPVLVEELASLRISWVGAWLDNAHPDGPAGWQHRLADAKARLQDGNWGMARCGGRHDGSGLDQVTSFRDWQGKPEQDTAFNAAVDRTLGALPGLVLGPGNAAGPQSAGGES
jgi:hypothetical protein